MFILIFCNMYLQAPTFKLVNECNSRVLGGLIYCAKMTGNRDDMTFGNRDDILKSLLPIVLEKIKCCNQNKSKH